SDTSRTPRNNRNNIQKRNDNNSDNDIEIDEYKDENLNDILEKEKKNDIHNDFMVDIEEIQDGTNKTIKEIQEESGNNDEKIGKIVKFKNIKKVSYGRLEFNDVSEIELIEYN
ncbi:5979_t:CDS:1, partial [Cetraspora pellucida]